MKFDVHATRTTHVTYLVEADSQEEAIEKVTNGDWIKRFDVSEVSVEPDWAEEAPA